MDSMEEHRKALGRRIARLREEKKLTQSQLASDADITQPSLWAIEAGNTKEVTARTLLALANALGTTIEHLWSGTAGSERAAAEEAELLHVFRRLQPQGRIVILQSARAVLAAQPQAAAQAPEDQGREQREDDAIADAAFARGVGRHGAAKPPIRKSK